LHRIQPKWFSALLGTALLGVLAIGSATATPRSLDFDLQRSATAEANNCLVGASGHVSIQSLGPVELMNVRVEGLPAKTNFDFFVTQLPNGPFRVSRYQGDIET